MWCCRFKDGEWIVSTLRATQKGSIKACKENIGIGTWKAAKARGIRCVSVRIQEA